MGKTQVSWDVRNTNLHNTYLCYKGEEFVWLIVLISGTTSNWEIDECGVIFIFGVINYFLLNLKELWNKLPDKCVIKFCTLLYRKSKFCDRWKEYWGCRGTETNSIVGSIPTQGMKYLIFSFPRSGIFPFLATLQYAGYSIKQKKI